jgi:peptide/nickel transport system ATP-binding protein
MTTALLEARTVERSFRVRDGLFHSRQLRAVDGVDLALHQGETLGIVGESGCGKSTLARLLLGLLPPTGGEVRFMGGLLHTQGKALRRDLQVIFQDPYSSLNPRMTAGEIVERPLIVHHLGNRAERRLRVAELFDSVGLPLESTARYAHEFSGGQRQRIAVARAMASRPRVVIADEPTSALDVSVQAKVLNLLKDLQASLGLTYVFISHDMRVVRHMCDRLAVMYLGRIVEQGPTEEVFANPRHPYTRALLGAVPRMEPRRKRARLAVEGEPPSPLSPPSGCHFHPRCPWAIDQCRATSPPLRALTEDHQAACHLAEILP